MAPPPRTLRLTLAYDGSAFHGWQRQPGWRTVQETVEMVARRVLRDHVHVVGASRTDAGVHARGQAAHVVTTSTVPLARLLPAIGYRLPPDVTLLRVAAAPDGFHATRDARGKLYRYRIWNSRRGPGLFASETWHVYYPLDLERMQDAGRRLVGTHDFAAFANRGSPRETTVRTVMRLTVQRAFEEVCIDVEGDGFLYNQVRIMVGTLVEIGRGHWPPERVEALLTARDRGQAGPTAPPQGLCLQWVRYDPPRSAGDGA